MPGLCPEVGTECAVLVNARTVGALESSRHGQPRRRRPGAACVALLTTAVMLAAAELLLRWSPQHLSLFTPHGARPVAAPWPAAAFASGWSLPPAWALLCAGLLAFPLLTLWEISYTDLNRPEAKQQQRTVTDPIMDVQLGGGLGAVLVEFVAGRVTMELPTTSRRRSLHAAVETTVGLGQLSRSSVGRKFMERKKSAPEEVIHSSLWVQQDHQSMMLSASVGMRRCRSLCSSERPEFTSEQAPEKTGAQVVFGLRLQVCALCCTLVLLSVVNKVLFRIVLASVGGYVHALSSTTNLAYLFYSWAAVLGAAALGTPAKRMQLRGVLKFARQHWQLFASIGVCESVAFTLMPLGTPGLPKALVPVIAQLTLPMSMAMNTVLLGRRYSGVQALGVVFILVGIAMATSGDWCTAQEPGQLSEVASLWWPFCLVTLSYFFLVLSLSFKDVAFILSSKEEKQLDIFMLEGLAGLGQGAALLLQWPMNFALLTRLEPADYFHAVAKAFTSSAGLMPGLILLYWAGNILYRLVTLTALKRLSSITTVLANVLTVPLSAMVFCLPVELPLLGDPDQLRLLLVIATLVVCSGLVIFNLRWPCLRS